MANLACLPANSSLGYLAKSLGALKPAPWEKVRKLVRLYPKVPADLQHQNTLTLDQRSLDAALAVEIFLLESKLQHKDKILPLLFSLLRSLPHAKLHELREINRKPIGCLTEEFSFHFVALLLEIGTLQIENDVLNDSAVSSILNVFEEVVQQCCAVGKQSNARKAFVCRVTIPLLLGICQAISAYCSGPVTSDNKLLFQKQCKWCLFNCERKEVHSAVDSADGQLIGKSAAFVKVASETQLQSILTQIEKLVLSECLSEIDTILAELKQAGSLPDRFPYHHFGELVVDAAVNMLKDLCIGRTDFSPQLVEAVQTFIKNLFIQEKTGVQKSKHSRHDLQWKFQILASCVDLLVWSAKDDTDVDDLIEPLVEYLNSSSSFGLIQTDADLIVCCLNSLGKLACKFESRAR